jgi:hypothetical protein
MNTTAKLLTLAGAAGAIAFAMPAAPALADSKPCCYNNGEYFESSPSTCRRYGGYTVDYSYCSRYYDGGYGSYYDRGYYDRGPSVSFSIDLGNVILGYSDGYYDRYHRWHRWRSDREREYYRKHRGHSYHHMRRDEDRSHRWRDWD